MVRTVMAIKREIEDAWSIQDTGASGKRKEDQPSSSSGKKQKTFIPRGFQGMGRSHQSKGHIKALGLPGPITCFHCHQPGHMKQDYPQRQGSRSYGTP